MKKWILLTLVALIVMLGAKLLDQPTFAGVAKLTASTGFILAALSAGALSGRYGKAIMAGLFFSWWGDAFLIGSGDVFFQLGLVSFLTAHLLYCAGFILHGVNGRWILASLVPVGIFAGLIVSWIIPHVPPDMRVPVWAYIGVITTMVLLAFGARGHGGPIEIPVGAVLFYLSDISVAIGQFMDSPFPHYLWGLPFYFIGQLFLAASIAAVNDSSVGMVGQSPAASV